MSGKVNSGVQAVGSKMSEINQQYQISEKVGRWVSSREVSGTILGCVSSKVGSSLSRGMSAMNNWISGNHQEAHNKPVIILEDLPCAQRYLINDLVILREYSRLVIIVISSLGFLFSWITKDDALRKSEMSKTTRVGLY